MNHCKLTAFKCIKVDSPGDKVTFDGLMLLSLAHSCFGSFMDAVHGNGGLAAEQRDALRARL